MYNYIRLCIPLALFISSWNSKKISKKYSIENENDALHSTTWLIISNLNDPNKGLGTGYFFYINDSLYLITNDHITKGYSQLTIDLQWSDEKTSFTFDKLQERILKMEGVDLVAINLSNIDYLDLNECLQLRAFTELNIPTKEDIDGLEIFNDKIIALSYPQILLIPPSAPYVFHGTFASKYATDFEGKPEFAINADLGAGCSGSPIFCIKNKKYLLLGTFRYEFGEYKTVDSINMKTFNAWTFDFEYSEKKGTMEGYRVFVDRKIGLAIKSRKILELLNK